jgi:predicted porin
MKKKLLAAAVVGALASPVAFGQTLYGIVDLGYQNAKHSDGDVNKDFMVQGQHSGSRLGVRGSEDLAGGTYAMYQIEFNIQADTGAAAATGTQRLTIVGLGSKAWGELTLGQQYTHTFHTIAVGSATAYALFTSPAGQIPELTRASNSIKYSSPVMGGFSVGAIWSPSGTGTAEPTAAGAESNYWDAAIRYTPGPFGVALSHAVATDEFGATAATLAIDDDPTSPTFGTPIAVAATGAGEDETTMTMISANWDNRAFGIYGNYWQAETETETGTTTDDLTGWSISGIARFGGRHEVAIMYGSTEDDLVAGSEGKIWAVSYQHVMSKRTRFYVGFADADNDAGAAVSPTAFAASVAAGYDPRGFQLGIVHTF